MKRRRLALLFTVTLAVAAGVAALLYVDRRGDDGDDADERIELTRPAGSLSIVGASASTAQPVARIPGITVIGTGDVEVEPDAALVRLTVGSGSRFGDPDESVALVDEAELEPVVDAVAEAGAPRDEIDVNVFPAEPYDDDGAAQITAKWPRPRDLKPLFAAAQRALRTETEYNLQGIGVVFTVGDCDAAEAQASAAALADARTRAERLAKLSDAKLGRVIAVSEATTASALVPYAASACEAEETAATPYFEFQASSGDADEVTVTSTLEVTFAVASR